MDTLKNIFLMTCLLLPTLSSAETKLNSFFTHSVFKISTNSKKCTASIIFKDMTPKLITAAHCINHLTEEIKLNANNKTYTLNAKKIDRDSDLAELHIPENLKTSLIHKTNTTSKIRPYTLALLGYTNGKPIIRYAGELKWPNFAPAHIKKETTSLINLKFLLNAAVKASSGMSGGLAVDINNEIIGLIKSGVPEQNSTQIIPTVDILTFIDNQHIYINHLTVHDSNTHKDMGENTQADVGENTQADVGTGSNLNCLNTKNNLKVFQEPKEGVPSDSQEGYIVGYSNGYQIDGYDDLRNYNNTFPNKRFKPIIRNEKNEIENLKIRKNIFKRFLGNYQWATASPESTQSFLSWNDNSQNCWQPRLEIKNATFISIFKKGKKYKLHITSKSFDESSRFTDFNESFTLTPSKDFKSITLVNEHGESLKCKNNNYLKLICNNKDRHISLSKNNTLDNDLKFRWVKRMQTKSAPIIQYLYGEVYTSNQGNY